MMAAHNNSLWSWDYESFKLDQEFPLAISQSLWDDWAYSLVASTPSSQIIQQPHLSLVAFNNNEGKTDPEATAACYQVRDFSEESPRCKRRRMLLFPGDESHHLEDFDYGYMRNDSDHYDLRSIYENIQLRESTASSLWLSDEHILSSENGSSEHCPQQQDQEPRTDVQTTILGSVCHQQENRAPVSANVEVSRANPSINTRSSLEGVGVKKVKIEAPAGKKAKLATPVLAYPFAVLKPSVVEGAVTLNDINKRILMPPRRPIQHPVGDYAKPPSAASSGSGISGKAVVALTKIHTQGKGTITIMRTKG